MSDNISKCFIERWEKIRQKDRINYSLIYAILFSIVFTLFKDWDLIIDTINNEADQFNQVIRNCLTVFVWVGYGFYILFWWVLEKIYLKIVPYGGNKKDLPNENSTIIPMSFDDQIKRLQFDI